MNLKTLYLALAVAGAVLPYYFFVQFFATNGFDIVGFVSALFVNGAAGGFSADLLISSMVFWIAMFRQQHLGPAPRPAWFIVLNLTIGLSCALPAYLFAWEKQRASA